MTSTHSQRFARRLTVRALVVAAAALVLTLTERGARHPIVQAVSRPIPAENALTGATDWDITSAGDPDIQGFATDISVNVGQSVDFKINAPGATGYQIAIYRLGYYNGTGARRVATINWSAPAAQAQPACLSDVSTGLVDCGNWGVSTSWPVPADAVSGIYVAKLTRNDNFHNSHIVFIVRDDLRKADIVFQTSDTTWQAYNQYPGLSNGGASLYCAQAGAQLSNVNSSYARSCATRAAKVSYNRPFDTRAHDPQSFVFNAEYPMVRWLEANGYDVKYQAGVDTDRRGAALADPTTRPRVFLSVGHDEYWSGNQRAKIEAARDAGVNLAFLSGNEMYWKTRYEADAAGRTYRTLVSYKETIANAKVDPAVDPVTGKGIWTGTWRDPRFAATTDLHQPENGLIGQIFTVNCCSDRIKIPSELGSMRLWANTGVSAVVPGDFYRTPEETLGYEWDEDLDNGFRPSGLIRLSSTTLVVPEKLVDFGANVAQGQATHSITLYRSNSGALVFGAGTVQWSWGLDGTHDRGTTPTSHNADQAMQQATVNLLADMDAQPDTLQQGADPNRPLIAPAKSTDIFAPISTIVSPAGGATVVSGNRVTITGTATDQGGGHVAGVEVSIDGGNTWRAATGTVMWSFDWTPGAPGAAVIRSRAIDDSGNLEAAGAGVTVTIADNGCPCTSIWKSGAVPAQPSASDNNAVELGVKFKSDVDGFITGIRFYKGTTNTGTHIGNLWTEAGGHLATATFDVLNETPSGWQQVDFATPVAITANAVYVASYHTTVGNYAADGGYFANVGVDSPPLHALASTASRPNGVFSYGLTGFPMDSFNATNYWVDIVFAPTLVDTTPPQISGIKSTIIDSSRVTITWNTDELATTRIDYGTDPSLLTASLLTLPPNTTTISNASFSTAHSTPLVGLRPNTTYYYLVTATDHSGNTTTVAAPTFTVPGPTLRDTASADFAAGQLLGGTYISQSDDGELILSPTVASEFTGPSLPAGWIEVPWSLEGYSTMGDGMLLVDGARVASCNVDGNGACLPETTLTTPSATFTAPHTLEFVANFSGDRFQHAGLGQTFSSSSEPWAIFSTMTGGLLFARTNTGTAVVDTGLGSGLLGEFHRYKIAWKADRVEYSVDGALVATHQVQVAGPMRPVAASDFNPFGGTVFVDWMRMSPYAGAGTFQSRIFDAASPVDWHSIQWRGSTPAGTSVGISVRGGNTPTPDATWTNFTPMVSGGPITLHSQFIQYRAVFASADPDLTPSLDDIVITTGHAPVANADSAVVPQNGLHLFAATGPSALTANDTDVDPGDVLQVVGVTAPSHGSAVLGADGSVTYTPATNYSGPDAFTYTVSDGLLTAVGQVTVDVRLGNIAPVAVDDVYNVNEDSPLVVPASAGVLSNDTDAEHNPLTAAVTMLPVHGTLSFAANGSFSYVPVANYAGPDSFRYQASDGQAASNEATVTINVLQVNDPPVTVDDSYIAVLNQPLDVAAVFSASAGRYLTGVLSNDYDIDIADTTPLHTQLIAAPAHGTLTLRSDGGFSYVPAADFIGTDTFKYAAVDHFNAVGNVATVTLTVALKMVSGAVNPGGTIMTGSGPVDPSDPLHSAVTSPAAAVVTIAQGVISASQAPAGYTFLNQQVNITVQNPDGSDVVANLAAPIRMVFDIDRSLIPAGRTELNFDMFRNGIRIPDCIGATSIPAANLDPCITERAGGAALNNDIRLTILTSHASRWNMGMDSTSTAPIATNDGPYQTNFQTPLIIAVPGVLGNDFGRSSLTASLTAGSVVKGTATLAPTGAFTFQPNAGVCGPAGFSYKAVDETGAASADATVSIVIDCAPHASDDVVTMLEDSGVTTIPVLTNDTDPDPGQTLTVTGVSAPTNGVAAVATGGQAVTYQPNPTFFGTDSFTYTVSDGHNGTATATVTVTVTPVNDAPSFTKGADQTKSGIVGAQTVANWATGISAGPANEAAQMLNFIVTNNNAALFAVPPAVAANGTLTYTPAANVAGSATVSVSLHDNGGTANGGVDTSAAQTFTIAITKAATTTTLTSSANPSVYGNAVQFTATVAAVAPGLGVPTGSVTFMDGAVSLGSATLDASGRGSFSTSALKAGAHSVTAVYGAATMFNGSTSSAVSQNVGPVTVTITADSKSRVYGQANPALTASYAGFVNGETSAVLTTQPAIATSATTASPVGAYPITASGAAAANYTFAYVNGTMTVSSAGTSTTAVASSTSLRYGAPLTLTATVAPVAPGAGTPTGSITFSDGAAALSGAIALVNGVATFSTSTLPVGNHAITAAYNGDSNFTSSASAPAIAITVASVLTKVTTTVADFSAGTPGTTTYISQTGDGEVTLAPTFGTEFSGTALPTGWLSTVLITKGTVSFANGAMNLQGAQVTSTAPFYGVGRSLEFAATFNGAPQQSAGLLLAQFVTKMNGTTASLYATTINGLTPVQTLIPGNWFGAEHRFRVDWTTTNVVYWIDGVKVATHNVVFASAIKMTIVANDFWKSGGVLTVNWMRLTPYVASGSYTSAVFNAGFLATWMNASWNATVPAGTTAKISYRTGNTATPDATWTAFAPVSASGGPLSGVSQYIQFMIAETTTDPGQTPAVSDVTIVYR